MEDLYKVTHYPLALLELPNFLESGNPQDIFKREKFREDAYKERLTENLIMLHKNPENFFRKHLPSFSENLILEISPSTLAQVFHRQDYFEDSIFFRSRHYNFQTTLSD